MILKRFEGCRQAAFLIEKRRKKRALFLWTAIFRYARIVRKSITIIWYVGQLYRNIFRFFEQLKVIENKSHLMGLMENGRIE